MTRPADRHPEAAQQTLRDRDASRKALENALNTLGLPDDFREAAKRAHVRPQDDDNRGARMLALVLIVTAVAVTVALVTVGAEAWWTERNRNAVETGE